LSGTVGSGKLGTDEAGGAGGDNSSLLRIEELKIHLLLNTFSVSK
jgi:hypothetical protein